LLALLSIEQCKQIVEDIPIIMKSKGEYI